MKSGATPVWKLVIVCLGLAGLVWIVFGQTLTFGFVNLDDGTYVYRNPNVIRGVSFHAIKWAFTHIVAANWHPLTILSHMVDCQLYGVLPGGHHLTNVLLHLTATILLFLVFWSMSAALWRSAFVAAVFAIHPLHVESVAWIAERKDVLSGVFFMLTIGAYLHYVRRPGIVRYLVLLVCFALGLMAKPMLVTLPFVLLLLDYWPLNRIPGAKVGAQKTATIWSLIIEKIPMFVLSAAASVGTLLSQRQSMSLSNTVPTGSRFANALVSLLDYVGQTFWPLHLAVFYPHPENNIPLWQIAFGVAFLVLITVLALLLRKKATYFLTGWLWFVGMLVPVLGIVQVGLQARADRYMYLPQIGLILILGWAIVHFSARWRHSEISLTVLALAFIAPLTWAAQLQTSYWRSSQTLWEHAVAVTSENEMAREHLADAYLAQGRIDDAVTQARQAVKSEPTSADAHGVLGAALARKDELNEAIAQLKEAMQLKPTLTRAHYNLGNVFLQQGELEEAIANYEVELEIDPNLPELHNNLANALLQKGEVDAALVQLRTALELNPNYAEARNNLAIALSQRGQMREAIAQWNKTLAVEPNNLDAQCNLAWVYATFSDSSVRNGSKAVQLAERALQLSDQKNARIWRLVAAAYAEAGRFADATRAAENGLAIAQTTGNAALVEILEENIRLFQQNTPLRDVASSAERPH